jgi:hypothetical protein
VNCTTAPCLQVVLQLFPLAALFQEGLSLSPFWQGITEELGDPEDVSDVMDVISRVADLEAQVGLAGHRTRGWLCWHWS